MRNALFIKAYSLTQPENGHHLGSSETLDSCRKLLLSKKRTVVYSEVFFLIPDLIVARREYEVAKAEDKNIKEQLVDLAIEIHKLEKIGRPSLECEERLTKLHSLQKKLRKENNKNNKILREWNYEY